MSDDASRPAGDPPGPLGLAARLRRETPVAPSRVIPAPGIDADGEIVDTPAPRLPLRERLRAREAVVDLLLFRVGADLFATDLLAVEEAMELGDVHPVPGAPPSMLGVLGLRGRLLPVYSPERALAQPPRPDRGAGEGFVLVLRAAEGARRIAIVVDDVEDVHAADLGEVQDLADAGDVTSEDDVAAAPAPRRSGAAAVGDVVLGVLHWNGALVALVDTDALAAACASGAESVERDLPGRETI